MNALKSELRDLRAQLEEASAAHAQEVKRLREQAGDLGRQRESRLREVSCLPVCAPLRRSTTEAAGGPKGALESKGTKAEGEAANIY